MTCTRPSPASKTGWRRDDLGRAAELIQHSLRLREGLDDRMDHTHCAVPLTRRELQVARLVARGRSNKEIAAELVISQRTAEGHVERILAKLGFTSRVQVAAWVAVSHQRMTDDEGG